MPEPGFTLHARELIAGCPTWREDSRSPVGVVAPKRECQQRYARLGIEADYIKKTLTCKICGALENVVDENGWVVTARCDKDKHDRYYAALSRKGDGCTASET